MGVLSPWSGLARGGRGCLQSAFAPGTRPWLRTSHGSPASSGQAPPHSGKKVTIPEIASFRKRICWHSASFSEVKRTQPGHREAGPWRAEAGHRLSGALSHPGPTPSSPRQPRPGADGVAEAALAPLGARCGAVLARLMGTQLCATLPCRGQEGAQHAERSTQGRLDV